MGNGPSLKKIDFGNLKSVDTFGLNAAYRAYHKMGWYPTYHGCFDYVVTESHRESFIDLVRTHKEIKRFFYLENICDSNKVQKIDLLPMGTGDEWNSSESSFGSFIDGGNSGVNACQVGVCLGYEKIILVGVDCDYVEFVDGAFLTKDGRLEITKEMEENPNYWFDDYQQKGDRYNIPQASVFHLPRWSRFARLAYKNNIEVVNCSSESKLKCFRKSTLSKELGM